MAKSEKTCTVCGATFTGGAGAMYCPSCKRTKKAEMERERRQNGSKRKIGSTDICEKCGAEYTVKGPLQKYCDNCKPTAHHAKKEPKKKKKNHIGAEISCAKCGKKFVITKINQKFCPDCKEQLVSWEKSNTVGVYRVKGTTSWRAAINGKHIGTFNTEADAIAARKKAESIEDKRYCVVCGREIPLGRGRHHALTCSDTCKDVYRKAHRGTRYSSERKASIPYKKICVEIPAETKARISAEAQTQKCTISKYMRELIQKEFDRLDEAKGGGDDERK